MSDTPPSRRERLSLNQITTPSWSLEQAVEGCAAAGLQWIGLWRDKVAEVGVQQAASLVSDAGLRVSSLCRGGFFPAANETARAERARDNHAAVEETAALGADVLVLVCGGVSGDLASSRRDVLEGIEALLPHAEDCGVTLAIEPLHPVFCADRSVVVTLGQALDITERFQSKRVGVVVDTYHLWWDPELDRQLARAKSRIASYQVSDWLVPNPDPLRGRGLMGDGVIDFARFAKHLTSYTGPIEVEIFNSELWDRPPATVLGAVIERYERHVP